MRARFIGGLLVLAVLVSALPWELASAQSFGARAASAEAPGESPRGPDPTPTSGACECLCLCSPVPVVATPSLDGASTMTLPGEEGVLPTTHDLPKSDFVDSLFHPPRLG